MNQAKGKTPATKGDASTAKTARPKQTGKIVDLRWHSSNGGEQKYSHLKCYSINPTLRWVCKKNMYVPILNRHQ